MDWNQRDPVRVVRRGGLGFTLIELLVTLAILAILAALAAPSFNDAILSNKLAAYANNFVASAQLARSEAIKRNGTVVICRSADGLSCATGGGWSQGWIVFADTGPVDPTHRGNGVLDSDETLIQYQQALSPDYHLTGNAYSVDFLATGGAQITGGGGPVTLSLCRATPTPGRQERTLRISTTGRTSVESTANGSCS